VEKSAIRAAGSLEMTLVVIARASHMIATLGTREVARRAGVNVAGNRRGGRGGLIRMARLDVLRLDLRLLQLSCACGLLLVDGTAVVVAGGGGLSLLMECSAVCVGVFDPLAQKRTLLLRKVPFRRAETHGFLGRIPTLV